MTDWARMAAAVGEASQTAGERMVHVVCADHGVEFACSGTVLYKVTEAGLSCPPRQSRATVGPCVRAESG
jgi:hypothetical protein